uniref:Lipase domain-containing protein n=1 Tax=Junco hyemalis TaxID=40217 RepID=A0A8C5ITC9_JUNHY
SKILCFFCFCFLVMEEKCPEFTDLNLGHAFSGTELHVQLLLYTRKNRDCAERLIENNVTASEYLNTTKKIVFVIHGYRPTGSPPAWLGDMQRLLLSSEDINLIIVDWNRGATTVIYTTAVENCRKVAEILKNYIDQMLVRQSIESVLNECEEHGLKGAQGLDPAGPSFTGEPPDHRLDPTDAQFVDVIHSDIDALGFRKPLGTIDFYPNGGMYQPGCPKTLFSGLSYFKCDHQRSVFLFLASLKNCCDMITYPCDSYLDYKRGKCMDCDAFQPMSCPVVGYHADRWKKLLIPYSSPTKAYFDTSGKDPFCMYNYVLEIITWNKSTRRGFIKVKIMDNAGNTVESQMSGEASTFQQYNSVKILTGFPRDIEKIVKMSLTFTTKALIGPRRKLKVLQMNWEASPDKNIFCVLLLVGEPVPCSGLLSCEASL